jgi:hypothetical protein
MQRNSALRHSDIYSLLKRRLDARKKRHPWVAFFVFVPRGEGFLLLLSKIRTSFVYSVQMIEGRFIE